MQTSINQIITVSRSGFETLLMQSQVTVGVEKALGQKLCEDIMG